MGEYDVTVADVDAIGGDVAGDQAPELPGLENGPAPVPGKDESAPYGRTSSGKPRKKPGPKPGTAKAPRRRTTPAPSSTTPASSGRTRGPDYRPKIKGTLDLLAAPLIMAGARNMTAALDGATIAVHAPNIAEGAQQLAEEDARIAAWIERVTQAGPYAALAVPLLAVGAQIMVNHGLIPLALGERLGAVAPERLLAAVGLAPAPAEGMPAAA